jgi:hypothetical protein
MLSGRSFKARRGRKRLEGAQEVEGLRRFDRRLTNGWPSERENGWQHEGQGDHSRGIGILTAGHATRAHPRHIMATVHVIVRGGRRIFALMMMRFDRALSGGAAYGGIGRPDSGGKRRIEQHNREQAEACGKETRATVGRSVHVLLDPTSVVRHYGVTRHSLQAKRAIAACPDNSLYAESHYRPRRYARMAMLHRFRFFRT